MLQNTQHTFDRDNERNSVADTTSQQRTYQQAVQALTINLQGDVVLPGGPDYEEARIVWDGTIDHYPALIVRCASADDVRLAIRFAREQEMPLSVRSGGHNFAGYGSNDGGVVIDLSRMKGISIDPERRTARLEAGLTWNEVANALQPYGLALSSGDTGTVGVGGLLLGGGIGWMVRKYGMTIDHVQAVELVTADGECLRASKQEHPELFWGLRGGGGNFGVATAFEVTLHQGGIVLGGAVFYELAEVESILKEYTRYALTAPDELTSMVMLMAAPPAPFIPPAKQGKPVVAIILCYTGDLAEGEQVVAPLRKLGTVISDIISPIPYPVMFAFTEEVSRRGYPQYVRSLFARTISDEVIEKIAAEASRVISEATIVQIRILGGAMSRVAPDATAFSHRDKHAFISVFNTDWQPDNGEHLALAEQMWQILKPYDEGVYVNFLADEGEQRVRDAYSTATYARLVALKNQYDPTNLFRLNQNIRPAL